MNVVTQFFEVARQHPAQTALVERGRTLTFGQMATRVRQTAQGLRDMGIGADDNVLVMLPVSGDLYITILAVFQMGARVVLVDALLPKARVAYAFQKTSCKLVITNGWLRALRWFVFPLALSGRIEVLRAGRSEYEPIANKASDAPALITFTSGSTGQPKPANRTHGFLGIQLRTIIDKTGLSLGDVHLTSFPVVTMCNLAVGATSVLPPKGSAPTFWAGVRAAYPPNFLSASAYHFLEFQSKVDVGHLQKVILGGATLLPHFIRAAASSIAPERVELVYGSTEAEPIATLTAQEYLNDYNPSQRGICLGRPHPNIRVRIHAVADYGDDTAGEIIVAGPHVLDSYYDDDAADALRDNKITIDGTRWHRTGDAGYLSDGWLYYLGRVKYVWWEDGQWQSPLVVEKHCSEQSFDGEATVLRIGNRNVVFHTGDAKVLGCLLQETPLRVDAMVRLSALPKDQRHRSRIDYATLANGG